MRRYDLTLAGLVFEAFALAILLFLLWCQWRGFDDSLCRAYNQCGWMDA